MKAIWLGIFLVSLALALVVFAMGPLAAHEHGMAMGTSSPRMAERHGHEGGSMMNPCKAAMKSHMASMTRMSEMNQKLDTMVMAMKRATGREKIEAMEKTLSEMVAQRKAMGAEMMGMMAEMMGHMKEHMDEQTKESMSQCPMMKMMESMGSGGS